MKTYFYAAEVNEFMCAKRIISGVVRNENNLPVENLMELIEHGHTHTSGLESFVFIAFNIV